VRERLHSRFARTSFPDPATRLPVLERYRPTRDRIIFRHHLNTDPNAVLECVP
jgi:hypothetical protein